MMRGVVSLQHEVVRSIIDNSSFDEVMAFYEHVDTRRIDLKQELETNLSKYVEQIGTETNIMWQVTAYKVSLYLNTGIKLYVKFYIEGHMIQLARGNSVGIFIDIGSEDKDTDISQYDKNIQDVLKIWLPLARKISDKRKELGRRGGVA